MSRMISAWIGFLAFTGAILADNEESLRLVPFPKEIQRQAGEFTLGPTLVLEAPGPQQELFAELLNVELRGVGLGSVTVRPLDSRTPGFRLGAPGAALEIPAPPRQDTPEIYALDVRSQGVVCAANDAAGALYGLQTLCQLIRANSQGNQLPCLVIRDWPSLRWRGFQDDMTRGPSSKLGTLELEAGLGSRLKLNLMTYYMEYQFEFKKHPQIGPTNGSLTGEELSDLVAYAKPLNVEILGNQQSFGHFGQILRHPEFAALRENADILTPVHEETYQLLDDLYSEVCPRVPFPWFNVCCDETDGLGTGPSRELAAKIGVGGVYAQHLRRIHDLLRDKYQKRMMMWGDIILQHPGNLRDIPKDTLMLTWGYDARANFEAQIVPFAKSGYQFFVCPGVNNWSRILPDFGVAVTNIQNFVRDGAKHGALGMLDTDWEDDGDAINSVKWPADAWAAECAWNASRTPYAQFNRRIGAVLFGERGDHFGQAVDLLAQLHHQPAMKGLFNARFWENDFTPKTTPAAIELGASKALAVVRPAIEHLQACRQEAHGNEQILDALLLGTRRAELIATRMIDGLEAARLYEQACSESARPVPGATVPAGQTSSTTAATLATLNRVEQLIRQNRDAQDALGREFTALWLKENKTYGLDWTLAKYTKAREAYDLMLRKINTARSAVLAHVPLPAPEEIGLGMPCPPSRTVKPQAASPAPLLPDAPWLEPGATHRLGLIVRPGAVDRFGLPVELELAVPVELSAKPVRAFLLHTNGAEQELLAQLDPSGAAGKSRLLLVFPGLREKGTEALVQLYLGLPRPPPVLPGAVRTIAGTNGTQWIENDKLRLLLGPEGAHLYRAEVKSLGNRDLTMPGETGWAGFADIAQYRESSYHLNCTAHGPAMVEFRCNESSGHTKSIRLYGGASWVEVFLGEPTSIYWDFDNPKNFSADGPTPGTWLFSNGQSGPVGREADGVPAQVKAGNVRWSIKFNADQLALGLITPETEAFHHLAPGAGAGGVGIEGSPPTGHFVTFAGVLEFSPGETMNRLQTTLDLKHPVEVLTYAVQSR